MPNEANIKDIRQNDYHVQHGRPLLLDYIRRELDKQVLASNFSSFDQ